MKINKIFTSILLFVSLYAKAQNEIKLKIGNDLMEPENALNRLKFDLDFLKGVKSHVAPFYKGYGYSYFIFKLGNKPNYQVQSINPKPPEIMRDLVLYLFKSVDSLWYFNSIPINNNKKIFPKVIIYRFKYSFLGDFGILEASEDQRAKRLFESEDPKFKALKLKFRNSKDTLVIGTEDNRIAD